MKKTIIAALLVTTLVTGYAQKDTVITDSTPLVPTKYLNYLLYKVKESVKENMTLKEYEDLVEIFNQVIAESAVLYRRKIKREWKQK